MVKNKLIKYLFDHRCTFFGVVPMSVNCVDATIELANQYNTQIMLIASRRQIDSKKFNGGYVNNWTTSEFVKYVIDKDKKLYLVGANIFSQYLISFGLDTKGLECIIDNDSFKQGKRLYGINFKVHFPKVLKNQNAVVILKAGAYNGETKEDILRNINSKTIFL